MKQPALRGLSNAGPAACAALQELRALLEAEYEELREAARRTIHAIENPSN